MADVENYLDLFPLAYNKAIIFLIAYEFYSPKINFCNYNYVRFYANTEYIFY